MAVLSVSAGLGIERRFDFGERRSKSLQHRFQHMIAPDAQSVIDDLDVGVAIAKMPGEACELLWSSRR